MSSLGEPKLNSLFRKQDSWSEHLVKTSGNRRVNRTTAFILIDIIITI